MKLTSLSEVKRIIDENHFSVRKKYGQNFLVDENILRKIVDAAQLAADSVVLEIGPGFGTLTLALAEKARQVTTVEIDSWLIPILQNHFDGYGNIRVIHDDALKVNWSNLFECDEKVVVVANLPYYITSPLIEAMLIAPFHLQKMVILVQKEVGERLVAHPEQDAYGSLSVYVQSSCDVEWVCTVPRGVFYPTPKVDSAVISITPQKWKEDRILSPEILQLTCRAIFGQRRKTLQNSLLNSPHWKLSQEDLHLAMNGLDFTTAIRGEKLHPEQIVNLANHIHLVTQSKT